MDVVAPAVGVVAPPVLLASAGLLPPLAGSLPVGVPVVIGLLLTDPAVDDNHIWSQHHCRGH